MCCIILACVYATRLQCVDVSENELSLMPPPHVWKSLGIRVINYTANKLTKMDLSGCKRFWSRLESLSVGRNKLKEVIKPPQLIQLQLLYISATS